MTIHKISATGSTNSLLKRMLKQEKLPDNFVLLAEHQTSGRGQMGATWQSQKGRSLTFSVLKLIDSLEIDHRFYISKVVSLSVFETLKSYDVPELKIKWPNDILSANKKMCGILIENIIQRQEIKTCILGVGINVNEASFNQLPNAASMKMQTGNEFALQPVLERFIERLNVYWQWIEKKEYSKIDTLYQESLYRLNQVSVFEDTEGQKFNGIIKGVTAEGKLMVTDENESLLTFDLKEIKLLSGLQ